LSRTVGAREIKIIRKDINKVRKADIWSENFQNKSKDLGLNVWIFLLIYACKRKISTELLVAHILDLNISYLTFLYYVNIYTYPFPTTSFKTHQIGIPEVLYVFDVKGWLKYHVSPSDIERSYSLTRHSSYSTTSTWITHIWSKKLASVIQIISLT
jgi:hypothetical protein